MNQLQSAFEVAQLMASEGYLRLEFLVNGPQSVLQPDEIGRLYRMLTAFFVGPYAPSAPGTQFTQPRMPDNEGFAETTKALINNLRTLMTAAESEMPKIWCDPQIKDYNTVKNWPLKMRQGFMAKTTVYPDWWGKPDQPDQVALRRKPIYVEGTQTPSFIIISKPRVQRISLMNCNQCGC